VSLFLFASELFNTKPGFQPVQIKNCVFTPHIFAVLINVKQKLAKPSQNNNTHTKYRSTLTWWGL